MNHKSESEKPNTTELGYGNGILSASDAQPAAAKMEHVESETPPRSEVLSRSPRGEATGPRTPEGKERSRRNSLKHGIFSKVALLRDEPRSEFDSLLDGLREDFRPEGTLEKVLVDMLAVLVWRRRRLLVAEAAEIQKCIAFPRRDEDHESSWMFHVVPVYEGEENHCGLMRSISGRQVPARERCLEILRDLQNGIKSRGFDPNRDIDILTKLYGEGPGNQAEGTLLYIYRQLQSTPDRAGEERPPNESVSPEQYIENFLAELEDKIKWLELDRSVESERRKLEALRRHIPDGPQSDRLLRYEASLERAFDRTLCQLERVQRMRRGQPVPPPIKLELST